jgi:hypothetical protein
MKAKRSAWEKGQVISTDPCFPSHLGPRRQSHGVRDSVLRFLAFQALELHYVTLCPAGVEHF